MRMKMLAATAAAAALAVSGCQAPGTSASADAGSFEDLRIMVPNSPGGGYDTTARTAAQVMDTENLTPPVEVFNLDGAGGTVGLARMMTEEGDGNLMMLMGLGVVGSVYTYKSDSTLQDTTPIARIVSEPETIVVPADSPYDSLDELVKDWKANPRQMPVGGGSSPGGPDHLAPHMLAHEVGITPSDVNYVTYDGGGPLLAALLGGEVEFGITGVGEIRDQIESGALKVLGVTSPERLPGLDARTLTEQGIDLQFTNWRGLVAPPGISDAQRDALIKLVEKLFKTKGWKQAMAKNGWTPALLPGQKFEDFIASENQRVEDILAKLGLV
ncbi:MAG: tripartite tricarboxylate transporter substrate binding protein [Actinomycetota bacterium]|nr:tripartite tricarboxylate transporter substrate binding protein [Actinomycetota bacterium]